MHSQIYSPTQLNQSEKKSYASTSTFTKNNKKISIKSLWEAESRGGKYLIRGAGATRLLVNWRKKEVRTKGTSYEARACYNNTTWPLKIEIHSL